MASPLLATPDEASTADNSKSGLNVASFAGSAKENIGSQISSLFQNAVQESQNGFKKAVESASNIPSLFSSSIDSSAKPKSSLLKM